MEQDYRIERSGIPSAELEPRTIPRSRHNPQLNRDTLPEALRFAGIAYTHRGTAPRGPARLRASPDRRQTRETGTAP
jgi:hypothetical protein